MAEAAMQSTQGAARQAHTKVPDKGDVEPVPGPFGEVLRHILLKMRKTGGCSMLSGLEMS